MNYKASAIQHFAETALTDFSKMEAVCLETLESLKVGDEVMVIYFAKVEENNTASVPISIPLSSPKIIKVSSFEAFSNHLLNLKTDVAETTEEDKKPA